MRSHTCGYDCLVPDPFIDLHTHSSVSDGTEPPAALVRAAAALRGDGLEGVLAELGSRDHG